MDVKSSALDASERSALFPLTVFDRLFERTTFVTGWLLEGTVDTDAFAAALDRLTRKWRLLSGRLQSVKVENEVKWYIKIPIGSLPPDYPTYALTTSTSLLPLSHYVHMPLPSVSESLPPTIFLHPSTPRQYTSWESTNHPLTCWNVVYFPASANDGVAYSCIGFARSHGIFDGGGASIIMNALVAEMKGQEWAVPPLPHEGINFNPVEQIMQQEILKEHYATKPYVDQPAYSSQTICSFFRFITWHYRERYWRGAERKILILPKPVMNVLVQEVRSKLENEKKNAEHVTSGDVLVAWLFKVAYSTQQNPKSMVHCSNIASFRSILANQSPEALTFPHNAFVPLPYPVLSVADIKSFPLHALTNLFSASRTSLSMHHVVSAYNQLQQSCIAYTPAAEETMMVSNVSASRILESDWSAIGAKRTICGYRYQATPMDLLFANAVYIAGRLDDGSVVLDVTLNRARFEALSGEIQRLTKMAVTLK